MREDCEQREGAARGLIDSIPDGAGGAMAALQHAPSLSGCYDRCASVSLVRRMRASPSLLDATNTVSIGDAQAVAEATDRILVQCFGDRSFDRELLHASFTLVGHLFAGERAGYLACDMPYHDLRHSLDTALVTARLIAGYQREQRDSLGAFTPEHGLLGILLGLLHDTGFIRKTSEAMLCGPQLMSEHESRSVEFARNYLETTSLAKHAALAQLILATRLGSDLNQLFAGYEGPAVTLGQMLGSADLLSQISDRWYLERCFYHLYPEMVLAGCDRVRSPDGREQLLYCDGFDLLSKTPWFYENIVRKRLTQDFQQVDRHLAVHFGGADPYAEAIHGNLDRCARMVAKGPLGLLQREPITTTRNVAAIYHARPPSQTPVR
ncbi:MAG: hypothetical protein WCB48_05385 [Casimicrobiaceae bacterium]